VLHRALVIAFVATLASTLTTNPAAAVAAPSADGLLVVGLSGGDLSDLTDAVGGLRGVRSIDVVEELDVALVEVEDADLAAVARSLEDAPGVESVQLDARVQIDQTPNDPGWSQQWGPASIGAPAAWDLTTGSSTTVIAVIDTGVTVSPDLTGRVLPGKDLVNNDADATDDQGHGSHVATVAAAMGGDGVGIAGICWTCQILPVKVLDSAGSGYLSDVAEGIVWAADNGADVINLSLGGATGSTMLTNAVAYAAVRGVVLVGAAGNNGSTSKSYPGAVEPVIAVAASNSAQGLYSFSQRGSSWVDVAAPGCNRASGRSMLVDFCGTSSAAPVVAGVVGLLRSARPELSAPAIRAALESTTKPLTLADVSANGVVDARRSLDALAAAVTPSPALVVTPDVVPPSVSFGAPDSIGQGALGVDVSAGDDRDLAAVELTVNGQLLARTDLSGLSATTRLTFDSAAYPDGSVLVSVTVLDRAGNAASAGPAAVRIDNARPVAVMAGPNGARVRSSVTVMPSASDGSGIRAMLVAANGKWVALIPGGAPTPVMVPTRTRGPVRIASLVLDNAGRVSISNVITVNAQGVGRSARSRL